MVLDVFDVLLHRLHLLQQKVILVGHVTVLIFGVGFLMLLLVVVEGAELLLQLFYLMFQFFVVLIQCLDLAFLFTSTIVDAVQGRLFRHAKS